MSTSAYLLAEHSGHDARRQCLYDLDRVLEERDLIRAAKFLDQWGEGMRDLLRRCEDLMPEDVDDDEAQPKLQGTPITTTPRARPWK